MGCDDRADRRRVRPRLLIALVAAALLVPCGSAAGAPSPARDARTALKLASGLTRLKLQRPVPVVQQAPAAVRQRRTVLAVRLYPAAARAHDASLHRALGLTPLKTVPMPSQPATLFYDAPQRRIVVPRGSTSRHALVRAATAALLDQHFDLSRAHRLAGNRDAFAAARAATDGYSHLVAQLVGTRAPAAHASGRLARFLRLVDGFHSSRGVRFAAELRNLGSNRAVWTSLRVFPQSTEQVFHLHKFLQRERPIPIMLPADAAGLALASDDTWGELDVRALLATYRVAKLDAAATGWGGGRSAVYRAPDGEETVALALDWDTPRDAQQWQDAAQRLVATAFHASPLDDCVADVCWTTASRGIAFVRTEARTALVFAPTAATAADVARALVAVS